jgi:hypothetical protein
MPKPKTETKKAPLNLKMIEDQEEKVDAMEAAVIAELVRSGLSYKDARAQVLGEQNEAAPAKDEDPEPPVIPRKSKDFSDDQIGLYNLLEKIDEKESYSVTVNLPPYLMEWTIRKTLQEAYTRNNPNFLVEDFLILLLKEQRAIDPTKGGKVTSAASGPKDMYNPHTGKWG